MEVIKQVDLLQDMHRVEAASEKRAPRHGKVSQ